MKHTLQLKLSQHLTLTPQLQQSIRLLQLSTLELNAEVERLLQENPLLEKADDDEGSAPPPEFAPSMVTVSNSENPTEAADEPRTTDFDVLANAGGDNDWGSKSGSGDDDDEYFSPQQVATCSLRYHLNEQLALMNLPLRDRQLASALVDALDDDGYLTTSLEELLELFPDELGFDADDLSSGLTHLQNLEPAGVGARDAAECLALQLKAMPASTPFRAEGAQAGRAHLPLLAARDFAKLKRLLHTDDDGIRGVRTLITSLNPRPGGRFAQTEANFVIPDVVVKKVRGKWMAALNESAMPKLRLNRIYADILTRNREASNQQLSAQLQEAKWLIRNVQQRFETILRVSQAIVDRQRHFFDHGEVAMRPMVLREIAEILSLHESTISRVTTQKYMLTSRGLMSSNISSAATSPPTRAAQASATAIARSSSSSSTRKTRRRH
jgi:RNA polymerase sigma-54 factor